MPPWNSYKEHLVSLYGEPVYRIGIVGGFSCPNRENGNGGCVYCDALGASAAWLRTSESSFRRSSPFEETIGQGDCGRSRLPLRERIGAIEKQIEKGRDFILRRYGSRRVSLYFQAFTNTYAPVQDLKKLYDAALDCGDFTELIVSTRPDCLTDETIALLASYRDRVDEVWVELGLQSASDRLLRMMNRGHDVSCWQDAVSRASGSGLKVGAHVILGFPTETDEDQALTVETINRSAVSALKIHNLNITARTALLGDYFKGEITAPSFERHLQSTVLFLRRLRPDIVIERLICETPAHRLASPRQFPDKSAFLRALEQRMRQKGAYQGDLCAN